jgi:cyclopropane fatty-acyl-phospholipid synthase-like methyltransferase
MRSIAGALALTLVAAGVPAQHAPAPHEQGERHGNPADLESYIASMEEPGRAAWQKPDQVVGALGLAKGQTACDIGSGPGYFSLRLARAVAPGGRVYAVDVETAMLEALRQRLEAARLTSVTPVLSLPADPLLADGLCDVVLIVNTYHHFPDPPAYLGRLKRSLRPGGRIVNIDFEKRETPHGPPVARRVAREDFVAQARSAGLEVVAEPALLPYQYFVVLKPRAH